MPPDESCSKGTRVHFFLFFQGEPGQFRTGVHRIPREAVLLWSLETLSSVPGLRGDMSGSWAPFTSATFPQESELKARMNGHDA